MFSTRPDLLLTLWSANFPNELGMSLFTARRYIPTISELMFIVTGSNVAVI
jgi:hypothetical protein